MMQTDDPHTDLTDLFKAEDRALLPEPFVSKVQAKIGRKRAGRRLLLAVAGLGGAAIAAFQLPYIWPDTWASPAMSLPALTDARQQMDGLSAVEPVWLIIGIVVLLGGAILTLDRA